MRVALVPGVPALLPENSGTTDPVAQLRAACLAAVAWLTDEVVVLADTQGARVARHLLETTVRRRPGCSYLVVGNGSACRSEAAPGHLDPRGAVLDRDLEAWLTGERALPPSPLSTELGAVTEGMSLASALLHRDGPVTVDYADDPFGVQYWVARWDASLLTPCRPS